MRMGYARRHVTGKHGHSPQWHRAKLGEAPGKPISKSKRLRALANYKAECRVLNGVTQKGDVVLG